MKIRNVQRRGLRRLIEENDARELRPDLVKRTRNILTALLAAANRDGVAGPPGWRIHRLTGDRMGTGSYCLSGDWRITFEVDGAEMRNLDLEDYH